MLRETTYHFKRYHTYLWPLMKRLFCIRATWLSILPGWLTVDFGGLVLLMALFWTRAPFKFPSYYLGCLRALVRSRRSFCIEFPMRAYFAWGLPIFIESIHYGRSILHGASREDPSCFRPILIGAIQRKPNFGWKPLCAVSILFWATPTLGALVLSEAYTALILACSVLSVCIYYYFYLNKRGRCQRQCVFLFFFVLFCRCHQCNRTKIGKCIYLPTYREKDWTKKKILK